MDEVAEDILELFILESSRHPPERNTPEDCTYYEIELYERTESVK